MGGRSVVQDQGGPSVLIAGGGLLGAALARKLVELQWQVVVLTRREASAQALREQDGLAAFACDFPEPRELERLVARPELRSVAPFTHVVAAASSGGSGSSSDESLSREERYRRVYLDGTRRLLSVFPSARLLFTGSTSVYGQQDGAEVTEKSETEPQRETGRILLQTEQAVLSAGGLVARLGGLYAAERWITRDRILAGTAVLDGDGSQWVNLIHRDDAVAAFILLLTNPKAEGIYNVTDGRMISQKELYFTVADALGLPRPASGPLRHDRKRGWSHKRVLSTRLQQLGWSPQFSPLRTVAAPGA